MVFPPPPQEKTDAFATRTRDVPEHATGAADQTALSPRIGKTSMSGKRAVKNIDRIYDRAILLFKNVRN